MRNRPDHCPCKHERPDPCPACGATVEGNDPVRGVCQARFNRTAPEPYLSLVLLDKKTGEVVASTSASN
jgi:hypothetical protein